MNGAVDTLKVELARVTHRIYLAGLAFASEQNGLYLTAPEVAKLRARVLDIEQALVTLEFGP